MAAMSLLAVTLLSSLAMPAEYEQYPECRFAIIGPAPVPVTRGPEEILSRLRFIKQPDTPVVVTMIDFSGSSLTANENSYRWSRGGYTVEVLNISDQRVSEVRVSVGTRWSTGGGGGLGVRSQEHLEPGHRVLLKADYGGGYGTSGQTAHLSVDVLIESMKIGNCLYKPSQNIPNRH